MRRIATVLIATAMATWLGHAAFAQAPQPTPPAPATPAAPATPSAQEKSAAPSKPAETSREQKREERRAARQAKRKDCVNQARAKKLKGDDRKSFLKTCVKS